MRCSFFLPLIVAVVAAAAPLTAVQAQSREIYINPKFRDIAQQHKKIAVLPFTVTLQLRPLEVERLGGQDGLEDQQEREGLNVQRALADFLFEGKQRHNLTVEVQSAVETNELLQKAGIGAENISQHSYAALAKILGADALVNGTFLSTQPMSAGAAVAVMAMTGFSMPTNTGQLVISLNDGPTGELLWKYDKSLQRGLGSDTRTIIYTIMRKAERQFPYAKNYKP